MYYLKWNVPLNGRANAFLNPFWRVTTSPWGKAKDALCSNDKNIFTEVFSYATHWKSLAEIVFIHPSNIDYYDGKLE